MKKITKKEQNLAYTLAAKYMAAVESRGDLQ